MKQTIKITRKHGYITVKGDGDGYMWQLASGAFYRGEMKPTFRVKLKRFMRRLKITLRCKFTSYGKRYVSKHKAAAIPVIGLIDVRRETGV